MTGTSDSIGMTSDTALRNTVIVVALANLAWFFVEFGVARHINSVALFADSADFFEDAAVNLFIAIAVGWSLIWRARAGVVLAALALLPAAMALWTAWIQVESGVAPAALPLGLTAAGALVINVGCALLLARHRATGSLGKAAWLHARNDALANAAMIGAALVTLSHTSIWPDLIVGLGIFLLNLDAAAAILKAARAEAAEAAA